MVSAITNKAAATKAFTMEAPRAAPLAEMDRYVGAGRVHIAHSSLRQNA